MMDFAKGFNCDDDVRSKQFKDSARATNPDLQEYRLNIYWTRTNVGVTSLETNQDVVFFSFNSSSACDVYRTVVAMYWAMEAAT